MINGERMNRRSRQRADRGVVIIAVSYAIIFGGLSVLQYLTCRTDGYDLAIFDQVVWNSLHGRLFENTILLDAPLLIGQRFSPILLAFVPLYALWNSAIVLLVVQTIGIAISVFPLYWFARARLGQVWALLIALTFFLFPALQFVNLAEFHEIALAIPLLSYATFFLLRKKYVPFFICLAVTLLVKEEIALTVSMFGAFIFFVQRQRLVGFATMLLGAAWFVFLLQFLLPQFGQSGFGTGYYYFASGVYGTGRYDYLGNSLSAIISNLVTRPDLWLNHLLIQRKIEFVLQLFVPLAFLPLAGPEISVLALPTLATSLLSDYARQTLIEFHYTAALIPFLFFGGVVGLQRIIQWNRIPAPIVSAIMLATSFGSYYFYAPGPLAHRFDPTTYTMDNHAAQGRALLDQIPSNVQVVAQGAFLPQLTHRQRIFEFPDRHVFCDTDYVFADMTQDQYKMFADEWNAWLTSGYFQTLDRRDGFLLARRKPPIAVLDGMPLRTQIAVMDSGAFSQRFMCANVEWDSEMANVRPVVAVRVEDERGHIWAISERGVGTGQSALQFTLPLVPTMPTGAYSVRFIPNDSTNVPIATLPIKKDTGSYTANQLQIDVPFFIDMREMRLLGYGRPPASIARGESLQIGLYWRARSKPRGDYMVAVQLRKESGQVALDQVSRPANNAYPTTEWNAGEVLLDWHDLALPADFTPGAYTIYVILHDIATGELLGEARIAPITVE